MSYYILPKNPNIISLNVTYNDEQTSNPYISHSLLHYYSESIKLINKLSQHEIGENFDELSKIVNPYEFIFSKVNGSKFSVSKIKPFSNVFYDFLEISQTLNLFDNCHEHDIISLHFGENANSTIECTNMLREDNNDVNIGFNSLKSYVNDDASLNNIDFIFYEQNMLEKNAMAEYINFLIILLQKQKKSGSCVIKIDGLFYRSMVDVVYLLTSLYERIYIIKPNTSSVTSSERYIVCKYFLCDLQKVKCYIEMLSEFLLAKEKNINSLTKCEIPYYFINKLEEANIIVGQQQIESLDLIVNILKNKNKEDKIETLKKNNLQKCIHWCEKYRIPCNKFSEKTNIFLPFFSYSDEQEENKVNIELFTDDDIITN